MVVCVCELENKQKLLLRIYENAHVVCHIVNQVNQAINNAHCDNNNTTRLTPTHTRTRTTTPTHTQPHKQHTTRHLHGNSSSFDCCASDRITPPISASHPMLPLLQEVSSVAYQAGARISILNITEPADLFNICVCHTE